VEVDVASSLKIRTVIWRMYMIGVEEKGMREPGEL
jgi:hypothetical protein